MACVVRPLLKCYSGGSNFFDAEKAYFSAPRNLGYLFDLIEQDIGKSAIDPSGLKVMAAENAPLSGRYVDALADVMADYYVLKMKSRLVSRITAFICYTVGIAFLMIPTAVTFFQIAAQALKQLLG
jgi:hypothetical protein